MLGWLGTSMWQQQWSAGYVVLGSHMLYCTLPRCFVLCRAVMGCAVCAVLLCHAVQVWVQE